MMRVLPVGGHLLCFENVHPHFTDVWFFKLRFGVMSAYFRIYLPKPSALFFKKKKGKLRWLEKEAFPSHCCVSTLLKLIDPLVVAPPAGTRENRWGQKEGKLITSKQYPTITVLTASSQITWSIWPIKFSWPTFHSHRDRIPQDTAAEAQRGSVFTNVLFQSSLPAVSPALTAMGLENFVSFDCSRNCWLHPVHW